MTRPQALIILLVLALGVGFLFQASQPDLTRADAHGKIGISTPSLPPSASSAPPASPSVRPVAPALVPPSPAAAASRLSYATAWGSETDPALRKFRQWSEEWREADSLRRAALLARGKQLADERRLAMSALIRRDPESALAHAVPAAVRRELPAGIVGLLEERVVGRGDSIHLASMGDRDRDRTPTYLRVVELEDGRRFEAHTYGRRVGQGTEFAIPLHGIAIDGQLALHESPLRLLEEGEQPADAPQETRHPLHRTPPDPGARPAVAIAGVTRRLCCAAHLRETEASLVGREDIRGPYQLAGETGQGGTGSSNGSGWTTGTKDLLVLLVDFPDLPGTPVDSQGRTITPSLLDDLINNQCRAFFDDVSYGQITPVLDPADVSPVIRLSNSSVYTGQGLEGAIDMASDAQAIAAGTYDLSNYDRVLIVFSRLPGYAWSGLGQIGGTVTWYNGTILRNTIVHEQGHNLGLPHANLWQVSGGNPVDAGGVSVEYGDIFDVMGTGSGGGGVTNHYNPAFLSRLGWLGPGAVLSPETSGTYRIHRFDSQFADRDQTLALRIERDAEADYWVSYRASPGGDISNGAYIVRDPRGGEATALVDVDTPGVNPSDASLNVGNTLVDAAAGLSLTVVAKGGSEPEQWIDVAVTFSPRIRFEKTVREAEEGGGSFSVSVLRTGNDSGTVTVNYATAPGSATSPADFTATSGTLSWGNGDASPRTITIPIVADTIVEGSEEFLLNLTNPTGGAVVLNDGDAAIGIVEPGAEDGAFDQDLNSGWFEKIARHPDGRTIVAGFFPFVQDLGDGSLLNRKCLAAILPDGSPDPNFGFTNSGADQYHPIDNPGIGVQALAVQPDGRILVGGNFTSLNGNPRNRLARLLADGTLDPDFSTTVNPNGPVRAIAVDADGSILIGGDFTAVNGTARLGIARLSPTGSLVGGFAATPHSQLSTCEVRCIRVAPEGTIYIGGLIYAPFNALFSKFSSGLLRLHPDGTVDLGFDIGQGSTGNDTSNLRYVYAVDVQPNGKVLVGGSFAKFRGIARRGVARLNNNGTVDTSFDPGTGVTDDLRFYPVRTVCSQGDGKVLVGGEFTDWGGSGKYGLVRLLGTGSLDTGFTAELDATSFIIWDIAFSPDNRLLSAEAGIDTDGFSTVALKKLYTGTPESSGELRFLNGPLYGGVEGGSLSVTVERAEGTFGAASAGLAVLSGTGTATPGTDFTLPAATLSWADGEGGTKQVTIPLHSDALSEGVEEFTLVLGNPVGAVLGAPGAAQISIADPTPVQAWRLAHFGTPYNGGEAADAWDADRDRLVNLAEYGLGISPTDGAPAQGPARATHIERGTSGPEAGRLVLVFSRLSPAPADLRYFIDGADRPGGPWTTLATKQDGAAWAILVPGTAVSETSTGPGRIEVRAADSVLMSEKPGRFLRLRFESFIP